MKKLFKYLLFIMLAVASSVSASAQTFTDKGFQCEIINGVDGNYVSITGFEDYQLELEIPAEVQYNGITYTVYSIGDNAFRDRIDLTSVTIPDSVTEIGESAFISCSSLTSVTIGESVSEIGGHAFWGCSSLTSVYISDLEAWCNIIFNNWDSTPLWNDASLYLNGELVTDLVIPDSVTKIGAYAFFNCKSLTSVTIPDSVTKIGAYAFFNCKSLTSVTIPDSVTEIGEYAFRYCSSLTSVTIPDSVTKIGESTFNGCSRLTSVTIGKSVSEIGEQAFYGCSSLTSITIPDSVTKIGGHAFYYCSSLTSITIPESVTEIGEYAFYYCSSLTSITIPDSVTKIGTSTFIGCSSLTSVTIGESVSEIGWYAFYGCGSSLTSVYISDLGAWCNIKFSDVSSNPLMYGASLYLNGELVTDLVIPDSVTKIGGYAFNCCSSLTSVTIGESVSEIGASTFYCCSSLTSVYISDLGAWCNINFSDVTSNPLYNGASLYLNGELVTDLVIPDSVTEIGERAFIGCSSLTSVTIPDSVTKIGDSAFSNCCNLTHLTIGESVSEIGRNAFSWCNNLSTIYSKAKTPPTFIGLASPFEDEPYRNATLYVPEGCGEAYKAAQWWSNFNNISEYEFSGIDDVTSEDAVNEVVGYYNAQGAMSTEPWKGLNIVVYSDGSIRKIAY